ncbi:MAG: peroxiredoxin [Micrococcaceae bacterium]|jgi:peroxiredoxin|uniref:thioredoxin-dependent peroxiredoxin n=1 Tax=Arthrobacter cheniae TaxID=1258888 RepID=A0A3A5M8C7_9MICC|nr:peroxiredoxin-like family protein [Arthrobacter cheniae]MCU1633650.1 peroxiredoxin [Micrococcaceae bacterium]RJT77784.1 AhpC/TSA family protein [Arthrobacter cheniae]
MTHASIASEVARFNEGFEAQIGPDLAGTFTREQADLRSAGAPAAVVSVGDVLPDAKLLTAAGDAIQLSAVRAGGPAVIVFYRGGWCPYCNITLRAYQRELLPTLLEQGIKLLAVSPQHSEGSEATAQGAELGFDVLSDPANVLARALGIVTEPSADARLAHTRLGFEVSDSNADGTAAIPYPAVLIVDAAGTVRFVDVHADYTKRTEVAQIVAALRSL